MDAATLAIVEDKILIAKSMKKKRRRMTTEHFAEDKLFLEEDWESGGDKESKNSRAAPKGLPP